MVKTAVSVLGALAAGVALYAVTTAFGAITLPLRILGAAILFVALASLALWLSRRRAEKGSTQDVVTDIRSKGNVRIQGIRANHSGGSSRTVSGIRSDGDTDIADIDGRSS
jgi:membrane protein implicated in regulation of membrane protease activity